MISYGDASNKSTDTWKSGLELHDSEQTILLNSSSDINHQYQVLAIINDNLEEFDGNNNPIINIGNVKRGTNHMAEGDTTKSIATE
jgi:hypothetical protein